MPSRIARYCPRRSAAIASGRGQHQRARRTMAALGFELACMCIQNCGVVLKNCASRSAVSAVTPRFTRTSSFKAHGRHPQCLGRRRPASSQAASRTPREESRQGRSPVPGGRSSDPVFLPFWVRSLTRSGVARERRLCDPCASRSERRKTSREQASDHERRRRTRE